MTGTVPGDVNDDLFRAGKMPDPLVGLNFRDFAWVKQCSWWYRKEFDLPERWREVSFIEVCLGGLDIHADVWLNGSHLGHHSNAFYPFQIQVGPELRFGGPNSLVVRLTTGIEQAAESAREQDFPLLAAVPTEAGRGYPDRGEPLRVFLRKPSYVWGWDWSPHLPTCGITGNCEIRALEENEIEDVILRTRTVGSGPESAGIVDVTVVVFRKVRLASATGRVRVALIDDRGRALFVERDCFLAAGVNHLDLSIRVPHPRLWWPRGYGPQHLYTVYTMMSLDGEVREYRPLPFGMRCIQLRTAPGDFGVTVNGQEIFIRGANWVPPDALYGRVSPARVTHLVEEAATANLNCLRIWGGGRYEIDDFYDACDRLGILVWQDFMSACAPLPADRPWFLRSFLAEAEHQIRRLRGRTCLLLFCGNNEVSQMYSAMEAYKSHDDPGWRLYHDDLPRLVRSLAGHVPYWPTSPYGGTEDVHDPVVGDNHHWVVMRPEPELWASPEYWDREDLPGFVSEYGYGGPCCRRSFDDYLGDLAETLDGEAVRQHTNTFYNAERVFHAIREHYRDPDDLEIADFLLLGGLCQGINLGRSIESLRARQGGGAAIFWMFADAWGETGWTIVDSFDRRKISYYFVARACRPVCLVIRPGGGPYGGRPGQLVCILCNDGPEEVGGDLDIGFVSLDGSERSLETVAFSVGPGQSELVAAAPCPAGPAAERGAVVAIPTGSALEGPAPALWLGPRYRALCLPAATPRIEAVAQTKGDLVVDLSCDTFAHAVHLGGIGDLPVSDSYFDLYPGQRRSIRVFGGADLPEGQIVARAVVPGE